jgi:hypothetical protein
MAWLWEELGPNNLIGRNVLEIFTAHLRRIPPDLNREFLYKKVGVFKRLKEWAPDQVRKPYEAFQEAMQTSAELREIYDWTVSLSEEEWSRKRAWTYPLLITPPDGSGLDGLLEFRGTVCRLRGSDDFVAVYVPGPGTDAEVDNVYAHLVATLSLETYVAGSIPGVSPDIGQVQHAYTRTLPEEGAGSTALGRRNPRYGRLRVTPKLREPILEDSGTATDTPRVPPPLPDEQLLQEADQYFRGLLSMYSPEMVAKARDDYLDAFRRNRQ